MKKVLAVSQEEHGVLLVDTEREAIGRMRRHRPDLVRIDTVSSDIDGLTFTVSFLPSVCPCKTPLLWDCRRHPGSRRMGLHTNVE